MFLKHVGKTVHSTASYILYLIIKKSYFIGIYFQVRGHWVSTLVRAEKSASFTLSTCALVSVLHYPPIISGHFQASFCCFGMTSRAGVLHSSLSTCITWLSLCFFQLHKTFLLCKVVINTIYWYKISVNNNWGYFYTSIHIGLDPRYA